MTPSSRTNISTLPRGHEFAAATFSISDAEVAAYLAATGDTSAYEGCVPPLAAVALGLRALQERLSLPEGALHTGQEVEHGGAIGCGERLTMTGRVAQRSERQGFVISVLEFQVAPAGGAGVRARTTIMAPGAGG